MIIFLNSPQPSSPFSHSRSLEVIANWLQAPLTFFILPNWAHSFAVLRGSVSGRYVYGVARVEISGTGLFRLFLRGLQVSPTDTAPQHCERISPIRWNTRGACSQFAITSQNSNTCVHWVRWITSSERLRENGELGCGELRKIIIFFDF